MGRVKGQAMPLAGTGSPFCLHMPTSTPLCKGSLLSPIGKKTPVLVIWWKHTNSAHLGSLVLDTPFNRPPDGHIKAKGLL